jgi:competence protein ComEC
MGGRGAVLAGIVVWVGVLLGACLGVPLALAALVCGLLFGFVAWGAPPRVGATAALLALACAACARGAGQRAVLDGERAAVALGGAFYRVTARVVEPPPREAGEPVAVVAVRRARPALIVGTRLRVRLPAGSEAEWGDVLDAVARVEPPRPARNPGGFDGLAVADAAALAASGRAFVARAAPASLPGAWPRATMARWRRGIERRLDAGFSPEARELVVPLVTGDRSALSTGLYAELRASGLIHLLALSGLHVVWLASIARAGVASLGGGVRARALAAALCAVFYAGIAGPLPSLLRAALHECLMAAAALRGRALDPLQSLALSALGLLACAPGWAVDLGFQLSFAATLGLVTFGPWLGERAGRWRPWCAPFIPTLGAQATALPLLLARFHAVSWVGTLSNLVAVPVSGLLLVTAWLGALTEAVVPGMGHPWYSAGELLAAALRWTTVAAARAPGALVAAGAERGVPWCAALGVALLALVLPRPRTLEGRQRPDLPVREATKTMGATLLGAALVCVLTVRPLAPPPGRAWLVALDVGQGDALALAFGRSWWLLDAGPRTPGYDAGEGVVLPFFRWAGVRRLEWLLLTHDDSDHAGGAGAVLRAMGVQRVGVSPRHDERSLPARRPLQRLTRGAVLRAEPLVRILWPRRQSRAGSGNGAGLVIEGGAGRGRLLFMADVDSTVEDSIGVRSGVGLLKVAHHGAASSTGARFLERVRPRYALLSVGARNRFGHPAPALLERLRIADARALRTDAAGALWFEWSLDGIEELDWRHERPGARATVPGLRAPSKLPRRR